MSGITMNLISRGKIPSAANDKKISKLTISPSLLILDRAVPAFT